MSKFTTLIFLTAVASTTLIGCATASKDISEVYISPLQYKSYDCQQLAAEETRLRVRMTQLGARLDKAADNDKIIVGASALLIYPIFFIGGNKDQEAEFARLKGEYSAVEQAAIANKCTSAPPAEAANKH